MFVLRQKLCGELSYSEDCYTLGSALPESSLETLFQDDLQKRRIPQHFVVLSSPHHFTCNEITIMQAARYYSKGDIRIEEVDKPQPTDDQVLLEVEWCGICGTDLHEYTLGPLVCPRQGKPHAATGDTVPVTLGHEFTGTVVEEGGGSDLKIGQKVMVDPRLNCQECNACRSHNSNLCSRWGFVGLSGGGGGFSQFVAVDHRMCYALPDNIKTDEAALIEPLCVARHGLSQVGVADFSDLSVLVIGGGPIGISTLWNLRALKAKMTIVSEPAEVRRVQTKDLADHVFSPIEVKVGEECRKLTNGLGVDVVVDCAGIPAGMRAGMDALKLKGVYVNVAGWEQPFTIPLEQAMMKEITIKQSFAYDEKDFRAVVDDFVAGKFAGVEKMITSRILLRDLKEKGFEELVNNRDRHAKILATPREELLREVEGR